MAPDIMTAIRAAGITLSVDGGNLIAGPKAALTDELRSLIRAHKPALLAALARTTLTPAALAELPPEDAACPSWRISIVGPRALNIELETRSAWTVSDWGRFARRHYGPDATVVARAEPAFAHLDPAALSGVSPEFAARLSPEDLADLAAGDLTLETIRAFEEAAIEREAEDLKGFFEERSAILEHDAGLPRPELAAARITATLARNRGYLWASLRAALALGLNRGLAGRVVTGSKSDPVKDDRPTLAEAGIGKHLARAGGEGMNTQMGEDDPMRHVT